jgi:hypothetical protein
VTNDEANETPHVVKTEHAAITAATIHELTMRLGIYGLVAEITSHLTVL